MAHGILCTNELVTASGVTFTHTTEVSGYPAENVQIYQPGESYRTSGLNPSSIQVNSLSNVFDTVALLYINATPHRNLSKQSNELDNAHWTKTNLSEVKTNSNMACPGATYAWTLTDDATAGEHSILGGLSTVFTISGNISDFEDRNFTTAWYVTSGALDCRLRLENTSGDYMECSFDLGAGTAGTPSATGANWSNGVASITSVPAIAGSEDWYRVALTAEETGGGATAFYSRLMCESGGSVSYSGGGDFVTAQCCTMENGSTASSWVATTTDYASSWQIWDGDAGSALVGLQHCAPSDLTDWDYIHAIHHFSSDQATPTVTIRIVDPGNVDGYIEIGNLVVAKSFQPTYNIGNDWTLGWAEEGSSSRSPGGQLYRPVNKRYRRLSMTHQWLTEAEAYRDAFEIDRRIGQSEGVLAVVDPDSEYAHQWSIWGLQDSISPILSRRYVRSLGARVYAKEWNIIEALP